MRKWPAIDVAGAGDSDLTLALVDDFGPTAVEPRGDNVRLFFPTEAARSEACDALCAAHYQAEAVDVDDEDWARRSQQDLGPVTVGRIKIDLVWGPPDQPSPSLRQSVDTSVEAESAPNRREPADLDDQHTIFIQPSMGFGTGHHATTRLCLRALQNVELAGRFLLDVGTGSGVLAITARRLGAARAVGIDNDPDAIRSANENLALNRIDHVRFQIADLSSDLPSADVIVANLSGAFLIQSAGVLLNLLRPEGTLLVSGVLREERHEVVRTFATGSSPAQVVWEAEEEGWMAFGMKRT